MLIGIISDTHDNLIQTKKAIELFNKRGVSYVIHAGDYTSPFTLKLFKELNCRYEGVYGNNDGDKLLLLKMSGGNIHNQPYIFELHNRKIIVMHEHLLVDALADSGHFELIIYGHTHEAVVKRIRNTLIINPGEAGAWLYGKSTVVIADLENMVAEIINL